MRTDGRVRDVRQYFHIADSNFDTENFMLENRPAIRVKYIP